MGETSNCCYFEHLPCVKPFFHAFHSMRRCGGSLLFLPVSFPTFPGSGTCYPFGGPSFSKGVGEVLVEACLWIRLLQISLALGPHWAALFLESWSWGKCHKDAADSVQQQSPLKRLLIICCPHPQGYSTSGPSQGLAISFSLDSESYSYTINAFFFFFFKASYSLTSVRFNSVAQLCLTLCDPMDYSMPGFPVHHQLKLMSIKLVMPSNHLILCHPLLLLPSVIASISSFDAFQMSQFFASGGQSVRVSASVSALPMNIQDWFPLGCTGWIFLQSKGLSRVFSNTIVQKHQFFGAQLSL